MKFIFLLPVFNRILPGISRTLSFTGNPCARQGESRVRIREIVDSNKRIYELVMHGIDNQAKVAGVNGMKILRGRDHKKWSSLFTFLPEAGIVESQKVRFQRRHALQVVEITMADALCFYFLRGRQELVDDSKFIWSYQSFFSWQSIAMRSTVRQFAKQQIHDSTQNRTVK